MFNNCSKELASVRCSARQGGGGGPQGRDQGRRAMLTGGEATLIVMDIKHYTGRGGGGLAGTSNQNRTNN
jgi:hypothetical protein